MSIVKLQPARIPHIGPQWSPAVIIGAHVFFWDTIPAEVLASLAEDDLEQIRTLTSAWSEYMSNAVPTLRR